MLFLQLFKLQPITFATLFCFYLQATTASPEFRPHTPYRPTCLKDIPHDVTEHIIKLCPPGTISDLSCVDKQMNAICTPYVKPDAHIGETPAFIPTVKRCFMDDNVPCFEQVLEYFQDQAKVEERHLAQLPALAAQLGAIKIFRALSRSKEDPRWNNWMTRAAIRTQYMFVKLFHGEDKIPHFQDTDLEIEGLFHRTELYRISGLVPLHYTKESTHLFSMIRMKRWPRYPELDWINRTFVADQQMKFPSVEQFWSVLAEENLDTKIQGIAELKRTIAEILEGGLYLMDDILPSPHIILSLWLNHYNVETQTINNDFLQFLLDEGAPISDMALILTPTEDLAKKTGKSPSVCKSAQEMAVRYASGSGTIALAKELHYLSFVSSKKGISEGDFVKKYVQVVNARIFTSLVLRELVLYLSWARNDQATIQYFLDQGLHLGHIRKMKSALARTQNVTPERRNRYKWVINMLSKKVHIKERTWLGKYYMYTRQTEPKFD